MNRLVSALAAAALLLAVAPISMALAKPSKVAVCHYSADSGSYHLLSVSGNGNAVTAHLRQGGALPGDAVPTMPGYTFDAGCVAQPDEVPDPPSDDEPLSSGCQALNDPTYDETGAPGASVARQLTGLQFNAGERLTVSWTANGGVESLLLYVSVDGFFELVASASAAPATLSHTFGSLPDEDGVAWSGAPAMGTNTVSVDVSCGLPSD
jgi:hypothetical protein